MARDQAFSTAIPAVSADATPAEKTTAPASANARNIAAIIGCDPAGTGRHRRMQRALMGTSIGLFVFDLEHLVGLAAARRRDFDDVLLALAEEGARDGRGD